MKKLFKVPMKYSQTINISKRFRFEVPILKKKIIIMAFDDSPHTRSDLLHYRIREASDRGPVVPKKTGLIGVTFRGNQLLHVMESEIEIDGLDSTTRILEMIDANPYGKSIKLILIDSPTMGGFNIVDPFEIYEKTSIPVILMPDERPHDHIINTYMKVFPDRRHFIDILSNLPHLEELEVEISETPHIKKKIYFHAIGIKKRELIELFRHLSYYAAIPEPLRVAHLIASRKKLDK